MGERDAEIVSFGTLYRELRSPVAFGQNSCGILQPSGNYLGIAFPPMLYMDNR
jgi:hypothetical protein